MIDLSSIRHIHIVGIGGISNSAIAEILLTRGYRVSGSDIRQTPITERLGRLGAEIFVGHEASHVRSAELVAHTAAVGPDNPEVAEAIRAGIRVCSRAELLDALMRANPHSIAVSGSHGKTSTCSLINHLLSASDDTTALLGGLIHDSGASVKIGTGEVFITEACEYKDSFLSLHPEIGIVLNVDADHLDYFSGIDQIVDSFIRFARGVRRHLILNADDPYTPQILEAVRAAGERGNADRCSAGTSRRSGAGAAKLRISTFGTSADADFRIESVTFDGAGRPSFDMVSGDARTRLTLPIPGMHNIYNAAAAFAAACDVLESRGAAKNSDFSGGTAEIRRLLARRIESFRNADRRFEMIGCFGGITLVDDYAHHPNEIRATIEAARRIQDIRRVIIVFQPHTYTRTAQLLPEFGAALRGADLVILSDIYAAREPDTGAVCAQDVVGAICAQGGQAVYGGGIEDSAEAALRAAHRGDMVITMGAGDVDRVGRIIREKLTP